MQTVRALLPRVLTVLVMTAYLLQLRAGALAIAAAVLAAGFVVLAIADQRAGGR